MSNRVIFLGLLTLSFIIFGFYTYNFNSHPLSQTPSDWGAFGDFIGGILNPLISFSALFLLMRTITQNEKALSHAQEALHQNEKALSHSIEEMIISRKELEKSAKAQYELTKLESKNYDFKLHEKLKTDFENNIKNLEDKISFLSSNIFLSTNLSRSESTHNLIQYKQWVKKRGYGSILIPEGLLDEFISDINNVLETIILLTKIFKNPEIKNKHPDWFLINQRCFNNYVHIIESYLLTIKRTSLKNGFESTKLLEYNPELEKNYNTIVSNISTLYGTPIKGIQIP